MLKVSKFAEEGHSVLGLMVSVCLSTSYDQSDNIQTVTYFIFEAKYISTTSTTNYYLCFVESSHQRSLGLQHQTCICRELLHLAQQLCILGGLPPLLTVKVTQVQSGSVALLGQIGKVVRQGAMGLVSRCLEKYPLYAVDSWDDVWISGLPLNGSLHPRRPCTR